MNWSRKRSIPTNSNGLAAARAGTAHRASAHLAEERSGGDPPAAGRDGLHPPHDVTPRRNGGQGLRGNLDLRGVEPALPVEHGQVTCRDDDAVPAALGCTAPA